MDRIRGKIERLSFISMKKRFSLLVLVGIASFAGGLFLLSLMAFSSRTMTISGKVISASTKMPLSDVMVAVESGNQYGDESFGSYVKTDQNGNFTAKTTPAWVSISAWKPGYAVNGLSFQSALALLGRETILELKEKAPQPSLTVHDNFYALKPDNGFSIRLGRVVTDGSADADFVITENPNDKSTAFIETQGAGGVIFQPFSNKLNFSNATEAPMTGYSNRAVIDHSQAGVYFLRTRDGNHYAKFVLNVSLVMSPDSSSYLDFEQRTRMVWVYQPDGTRNLERDSKGILFPCYKFGVDCETANQ